MVLGYLVNRLLTKCRVILTFRGNVLSSRVKLKKPKAILQVGSRQAYVFGERNLRVCRQLCNQLVAPLALGLLVSNQRAQVPVKLNQLTAGRQRHAQANGDDALLDGA